MPTVEQNVLNWTDRYDWTRGGGEEWSARWGGPEAQWYGAIYPRIHSFVPARSILEIAPGFGRWTNMLRSHCEKLTLVDLSETCIEACKQRFSKDTHIGYHVNDGKSLAMVPDGSIDFVFSFDSLVHAEKDVIEVYLAQLARKLRPHGVGFIHHSNLGMYVHPSTGRLPAFIRNRGWRSLSMTARRFKESCSTAGLQCIGQELVNWLTDDILNDCFSLFTQPDSMWARSNRIFINKQFMDEAAHLSELMQLYTASNYAQTPVEQSAEDV